MTPVNFLGEHQVIREVSSLTLQAVTTDFFTRKADQADSRIHLVTIFKFCEINESGFRAHGSGNGKSSFLAMPIFHHRVANLLSSIHPRTFSSEPVSRSPGMRNLARVQDVGFFDPSLKFEAWMGRLWLPSLWPRCNFPGFYGLQAGISCGVYDHQTDVSIQIERRNLHWVENLNVKTPDTVRKPRRGTTHPAKESRGLVYRGL